MRATTDGQTALPMDLPHGEDETVPPATFREPLTGVARYTTLPSPVGEVLLVGDGESLTGLYLAWKPTTIAAMRPDPGALAEAAAQLHAYFAGELRDFDLPLAPRGTAFQRLVWRALTTIPYGRTASYKTIASRIGHPGSSRAVGLANGRNPISIVLPCHRVIGSDGSLTGYGWGLDRKDQLLRLERGVPLS